MTNDNEWIEWNGGECPVPNGTPIDFRFRSEDFGIQTVNRPERMKWDHEFSHNNPGSVDIIAYRVSK